MISVLCPSRDRPVLLERSVRSLEQTAAGPVEILVAVDDDDPATAAMARSLGARVLVTARAGYSRLHEYYQQLAALAAGDWMVIWNDDAVMTTAHWDLLIGQLPETVLVADIQSPHSPLSCFPAVRRGAVDMLGWFSSGNPHVDTFWQDVGRMTGTISRVEVYAACDSPVKPDSTHGYYDAAHQAELAECARVIREKAGR